MKLRVAVNAMRLRLAVPAKRLLVAASAMRLGLAVPAMRLRTAVGQFVAFLRRSDTAVATDSPPVFATTRQSVDTAFAGTHTIEFEVRKGVSDGGGFDDGSLYFEEDYVVGAPLAQTYTLPLQVHKALFKPRADGVGAASLAQVLAATQYADAFAAVDLRSTQFTKVLDHGVGATDDLNGVLPLDDQTIEFFKGLDHITYTGDLAALYLQRGVADGAAVSSQTAQLIAKPYFEVPIASELVNLTNSKMFGHTAGVSEADVISVDKPLSEVAGAGSSGSLRSQGYTMDMTYFAEDYVGASRTF